MKVVQSCGLDVLNQVLTTERAMESTISLYIKRRSVPITQELGFSRYNCLSEMGGFFGVLKYSQTQVALYIRRKEGIL